MVGWMAYDAMKRYCGNFMESSSIGRGGGGRLEGLLISWFSLGGNGLLQSNTLLGGVGTPALDRPLLGVVPIPSVTVDSAELTRLNIAPGRDGDRGVTRWRALGGLETRWFKKSIWTRQSVTVLAR